MPTPANPDQASVIGYALAVLVWIVTMAVFWGPRDRDHWVLVLEIILSACFAAFWSYQTKDLWYEGVRADVS